MNPRPAVSRWMPGALIDSGEITYTLFSNDVYNNGHGDADISDSSLPG